MVQSSPPAASGAGVSLSDDRSAGRTARSILVLVLLVVACKIALALLAPVICQEAYYSEYAAHPALSYFDHPPMTAWSIWLGRRIFGFNVLGLRAATLVFSTGTALLGLLLLRWLRCNDRGQRIWLLASIAVPAASFPGLLAMTEAPLLFFWTLTLVALWRAREGQLRWWLLAGLGAGGALLSKYPAAFLLPAGILVFLFDARMRRQLLRPGPWLAVLVAGLLFLPVVYWNAQHDWASFVFQTKQRYDEDHATLHWPLQLLGGQILTLTPVVFACILLATLRSLRDWRRDVSARWLLAFGLPLPLFMISQSPWVHVKLNWLLPGYVGLGLATVLWWSRPGTAERYPRLRRSGRAVAMATLVLTFVAAPLAHILPWSWGNTWTGWGKIATRVDYWRNQLQHEAERKPGASVFYAVWSYKNASSLAYVLRKRGDYGRAPLLTRNVFGEGALEYDYWTQPNQLIGQDAVLVIRARPKRHDPSVLERVRKHFRHVELAEDVVVERLGWTVQKAAIWICRDYQGA